MTGIRRAKESDLPRILELYHELSMITTESEQHSSTSWDDYPTSPMAPLPMP
jgi:hypothetical protein